MGQQSREVYRTAKKVCTGQSGMCTKVRVYMKGVYGVMGAVARQTQRYRWRVNGLELHREGRVFKSVAGDRVLAEQKDGNSRKRAEETRREAKRA